MAEVPIAGWSRPSAPTGGGGKQNIIEGITPETWFSPLQPLPDFAPQSVQGRQWDYQVGYNLQITPRPNDKVTFAKLRALANNCDIMQIIIQNRKDQIEARKWCIKNVDEKKEEGDDPRIKELTDFFAMPDKVNTWDQWLRPLLEDLFVIDAPAVYIRRNRAGGVYGLEVLDGGTIALNVDQNGRRPMPPSPAFKQILKGVPAVSYTTDQLLYMPRNMKSWGVYGRSPIEMTMVTINAAINRALFNQNYYTEGNIPDAVASLPETFTPQQTQDFMNMWDSMYSGNIAARRKVKFIPGLDKFEQLKEPELKNVYDDYIARILCFALGISPQPFISQMNRATAEVSKTSTDEEGKAPIENWVKNLINRVVQSPQFFNYPDLCFDWAEKEDTDPAEQMNILTGYTSKAMMTINEARERVGLDADPNPLCNELGVITASGFVTLEQAAAQADATIQTTLNPPKAPMGEGGGTDKSGKTGKSLGADTSLPPSPDGLKKKSGIHTKLERATVKRAEKKLAKAAHDALILCAKSIERQLIGYLHKADDDTEIPLELDLSHLHDIRRNAKPILADVAADSGSVILGHLGIDSAGLVDQVNTRAVKWAGARSAELVTLLDESTRRNLQATIRQGLEDNVGKHEIVKDIMQGYAFSKERAQLIASTEVANANSQGSLAGMFEAKEAGVNILKEWDDNNEPCPICVENAMAGPIPIDQPFPSGDMAPLAHPHCECVLVGVTRH